MSEPESRLHRRLGLGAATVLGIAAMLGTGVFAIWSPALALAGSWLVIAVALAAVLAAANAWSTARLATVHPESGGVYAYGRIEINRWFGVTAGIAFIIGKSASAAAAALVIGTYFLPEQQRLVALVVIAIALVIDLLGIHRSVRVSGVLVAIVVAILIVVGVRGSALTGVATTLPTPTPTMLLAAIALCFFAFAGYARITVLGEEVRNPARTIPRAVAMSLAAVTVLYLALAFVVRHAAESGTAIGSAGLLDLVSPDSWLAEAVRIGVVLAAGAALLALLAGVGRTVFAMAANGDAPRWLSEVRQGLPRRAQVVAGVLAALVAMAGTLTWSLAISAGSVLTYYAIAHLAARKRWPRSVIPILGFLGCGVVVGGLLWVMVTGGLPAG